MMRRKLPGKKMINEYMETHEYDYSIISYRRRGKTVWKIERKGVIENTEDL